MPPVPAKWLRGPSDREAVAQGCWFDEEAGDRVCRFVETFCRQSKARWKGERLTLLDWQRDFLVRLFGWKRPDGTRRYRKAYLEVAKKNGKSTMLSALTLYLLIADSEGAPEVYLNAADVKQARIIFDEAVRMVEASPELAARLDIKKSQQRVIDPSGHGALIVNSSIAGSKDGLNASATIFDELHRQDGRAMWDVFEYAGASREQPLRISITTAGESEDGVWFEEREHSEQVNDGTKPDTTHLGVVYRALPSDDIDDPATWRKANPSLGVTLKLEDFAQELQTAKESPVKLANFKRLRLNIVARGEGKFLSAEAWRACDSPRFDPAAFRGSACWGGLDLSTKIDLTAKVLVFGGIDDGLDVHCQCYMPANNVHDAEKRDRVPYGLWIDQGWITATEGDTIDYSFIRRDVVADAESFDLRCLAVDPYNATHLNQLLTEEDGLPVQEIRQGYISLSNPTKELEALVRSRKVRHGGNPVLRWCVLNAITEMDSAGNIRLSKAKARHRIDPAAALVNAIAALMADPDGAASPYTADRGLISF